MNKKKPKDLQTIIDKLDLDNKQSIVDLLMECQAGTISCRKCATLIQRDMNEKQQWVNA